MGMLITTIGHPRCPPINCYQWLDISSHSPRFVLWGVYLISIYSGFHFAPCHMWWLLELGCISLQFSRWRISVNGMEKIIDEWDEQLAAAENYPIIQIRQIQWRIELSPDWRGIRSARHRVTLKLCLQSFNSSFVSIRINPLDIQGISTVTLHSTGRKCILKWRQCDTFPYLKYETVRRLWIYFCKYWMNL